MEYLPKMQAKDMNKFIHQVSDRTLTLLFFINSILCTIHRLLLFVILPPVIQIIPFVVSDKSTVGVEDIVSVVK